MTSIIITLLIVLHKIPLINILGDKGIGYYSIAFTIYLLIMVCISYGIPNALSLITKEQSSNGQYALVYKTCSAAFIFALLTGGFTSILVFFGADIIATYFMNAVQSTLVLKVIAPCIVFASISGVLYGIYKSTKAELVSKKIKLTEIVLITILSILGAYIIKSKAELIQESAYSSVGAVLGLTCGMLITCVYSLILFINHRKKLQRMAKRDMQFVKSTKKELIILLMRKTFPYTLTVAIYYLSNLLDYVVFNRIMSVQGHKENSYIILLGMLNGKYEFFISIPLLLLTLYATGKFALFEKLFKEDNKRKLFYNINKVIRTTMLFIIPCTLFYVIYAKPLMNLFFIGINDTPAMLLRVGAVSIIFYGISVISSIILNGSGNWKAVVKNAFIAMVLQIICLLIMMIIFQWTIPAVVVSQIIFAAVLFVLNEHTLHELTGYIQETKRCIKLPFISSLIMIGVSFILYFILNLFFEETFAIITVLIIAIPSYILALVFTGGITQREMYRLPGGKLLAPLCRKLHLTK